MGDLLATSMRPPTPRSSIAARKCAARRWHARRAQRSWHCDAAVSPRLCFIRAAERVPLTDREREIVMLIAEGLSSRAIAERLTLSVRTVEGHVYRAMAKTGTPVAKNSRR